MGEVILEMKGIDKSFPGVHALDHVDLEIRKGEVLALMGENGAGKSTTMNIKARKLLSTTLVKHRTMVLSSYTRS